MFTRRRIVRVAAVAGLAVVVAGTLHNGIAQAEKPRMDGRNGTVNIVLRECGPGRGGASTFAYREIGLDGNTAYFAVLDGSTLTGNDFSSLVSFADDLPKRSHAPEISTSSVTWSATDPTNQKTVRVTFFMEEGRWNMPPNLPRALLKQLQEDVESLKTVRPSVTW